MSEFCVAETYPEQRYGDAPQPAEYCENEAVEGEEYCPFHLGVEPDEPWDDRDYMLDLEPFE